jgi:hypothetical protein
MYKLEPLNDAKKIEELKEQCPDRELLELSFMVGKKTVILYAKAPSRSSYKQFKSKGKQDYSGALEIFVCDSVIHPAPAEFQKLLDRYPGLIDNVAGYLLESIGQSQDAEVKNL